MTAGAERKLLLVLCLTAVYMIAQAVGGVLTGSLALLADSAHMFADVVGLAMALFAVRFARQPATASKTYGFYRAEVLAALANSVLLLGIACYILYEAAARLAEPSEIRGLPMLLVALGGVAVNLVGIWSLRGESESNLNLRGAMLEVLSDLLSSLGVVGAALVIFLTGWWPVDPLISALIAVFIVPRAWRLLRAALDVLLEATPTHINLHTVEESMRTVVGVRSVHDLHVWTIASGFVAMSGHVQAAGRPSGDVLHDLQLMLRERFGIAHITLQVEAENHADDGACCLIDPRCLTLDWRAPASPIVPPPGR